MSSNYQDHINELKKFNAKVEYPVGEPQSVCAVCGNPLEDANGSFTRDYPNLVCMNCEKKAVTADGETPEHNTYLDRGDNPVFIDGEKCWRRYNLGGWITFRDQFDCDDMHEFYEKHFPVGDELGANDPTQ